MNINFNNKTVLIMGLGVNLQGSGLSSAIYLARAGANLIITDLRDEKVLATTMKELEPFNDKITYVLGLHRAEDFDRADLIVKNPGVRKDSPFLKDIPSHKITSDVGLFLEQNISPIIAITGSKGKSSTATAIHSFFKQTGKSSFLGGNITTSPLCFLNRLTNKDSVVLELSSWQLGDLAGQKLLKPKIAIMTNLLNDHQNYYNNNMQKYAEDKAVIFENQDETDVAILNANNSFTTYFKSKTRARIVYFSTSRLDDSYEHALYLDGDEMVYRIDEHEIFLAKPKTDLIDENMLCVVLALVMYGMQIEVVFDYIGKLEKPEHRLELVANINGVNFYNDSAATMPDATIEALKKLKNAHLIIGGMDKELDFTNLIPYLKNVKSINMFSGSASDKIAALLKENNIAFNGFFDTMQDAVASACKNAVAGDNVLLSPAAASFNLFVNEFDRGNQFKEIVLKNKIIFTNKN